ncbi:MAG: putative signal transducing protein [Bellilinea sp.]
MSPGNYQKVYSACGTLLAATVQSALERAGIPAVVKYAKNGAFLDVLVPQAQAEEARRLLYPERRSGEIYFVPACEMK